MKKLLAIVLAATLLLPFTACSSQQNSKSETKSEVKAEKTDENNRETIYQ